MKNKNNESKKKELVEYVHNELNKEIYSIGGHYVLTDNVRLPFHGLEILYLKGFGVFDTTCCGSGGCCYVSVIGFIKEWKSKKDEEDKFITVAEPVRDKSIQDELRQIIGKKEMVSQISFR